MPTMLSGTHDSNRVRRLALSLGIGLSVVVVSGSSPVFWRVSTQAEFLRGEVESLSVDADGHLTLGPVTDSVFDTTAPALWSLARARDGALWVGSGNEGRLYRVEANGNGTVVFDSDELDIYAIAADAEGGVFAATSPDGRIYRVTANGQTAVVFDPEDTYVWALAVASDGALYAATGNAARIYRISADGAGQVVFESDATHVLSLAFAPDGTLLAGTESPGQVLRIGPNGRAFVLLDASYEEIRSLRVQPDGSVLVVAVSGQPAPAPPPTTPTRSEAAPVPTVSVTTSVTAVVVADTAVSSTTTSSASGSTHGDRKGAVYRIAADGLWDLLWRSGTDMPFDAVFDAEGALLVGTGPDGKIYQVPETSSTTALFGRAPAQQVTTFLRQPDGSLHYATANPGKVVRLSRALAGRGTYESEVRDAGTVATWGTLSWRGATPGGSTIELSTRSGNTAIPNDTWSEWSAPYRAPTGAQVTSPNARYLQWRASLSAGDASPVLTSVTAAYLPRNLRPEVTRLTVHQPGTVFQQAFSTGDPPLAGLDEDDQTARTGSLGRQSYRKGIQTFVWQANDQNGDPLEYTVSYQQEGAVEWRALRSKLRDTVFAWDTSTVPDGAYRVRITASDTVSNAPGTALVGARESPVFDIDNAPPRVELGAVRQEGGRSVLPFTVRDVQSPIQLVELSQGDNLWRAVYPTDGIPDGRVERFEIVLEGVGDGTVIIRATDALRNTVTVSGR